jgi:hypothetical protein
MAVIFTAYRFFGNCPRPEPMDSTLKIGNNEQEHTLSSVADPGPDAFLTLGDPGGKKSRDRIRHPGSRMNIPDLILEN